MEQFKIKNLIARRRFAIALMLMALLVIVVTFLASADQMYVWQAGGHVYLRRLGHPFVGTVVSAGMLIVAAQIMLLNRAARIAAQAAVGFVTIVGLGFGALISAVDFDTLSERSVAATSGGFKLVTYESPGGLGFRRLVLRIRTNDGVASREGRQNVACFVAPQYEHQVGSRWVFERASLEGADGIVIVAKDGTTERTRFNTRTLAVVTPIDRCTGAPVSD